MGIEVLKGKIIRKIIGCKNDDELIFMVDIDEAYRMWHRQDCCENVTIYDICGDLDWLIDSPILVAEERTNLNENPIREFDDYFTWTFYELATLKGSVTIRWYGTSNGYYSESVDFERI